MHCWSHLPITVYFPDGEVALSICQLSVASASSPGAEATSSNIGGCCRITASDSLSTSQMVNWQDPEVQFFSARTFEGCTIVS